MGLLQPSVGLRKLAAAKVFVHKPRRVVAFLEGAARQPELTPMLQVKMFIVAALVDAVAMIGIGFALFFTFANPFTAGLTH